MTKMMYLAGQWMRNKEDLLMRDLFSSSPAYIDATGGLNGDDPSEISRNDVNNIERVLLGQDARTMLMAEDATEQFATAGLRDAFVALCNTDITPDLQAVSGVQLKNSYTGNQDDYRPEEYCTIGRFRFFVSSKGAKISNASASGATVYQVPMYGQAA